MDMIVIGHRGAPEKETENTISSFRCAISEGADWIECDVRLSKDNEVVIMHDDDLSRTTEGSGLVAEYTLRELKKIPCKNGEPIPTLEDVLDLGVKTVIDVKDVPFEILISEIRRKKAQDRVMISSWDSEYIRQVNECNEIRPAFLLKPGSVFSRMEGVDTDVAAVFDMKRGVWIPFEDLPLKPGGFLNIYHLIMVAPEDPKTSLNIVRRCREIRVSINVWIINHADDLRRCINLGVDGIITDAPGKIKRLLRTMMPSKTST